MAAKLGPADDAARMTQEIAPADDAAQPEAEGLTGVVLDIQRMSTEDGPGIRTTVFMKGCPLACAWCHNPESISPAPQLEWIGVRCLRCGICVSRCPRGALSGPTVGIGIDRVACRGCGACARACPTTALSLRGLRWTVDALLAELVKDRAFFEKSGGGITIGGGEPTLQGRFVAELLRRLKAAGLSTAIDTCGCARRESLDAILPFTDLVLFDIKEIDPEKHRRYTGQPNQGILESLARIADLMRSRGGAARLWIRTPLVPGATATEENVAGIGAHIASHLDGVVGKWELLAFNNLCRDKYARLGLSWQFAAAQLLSRGDMERLAAIARKSGVDPGIVEWSGATRSDEENEGESR